MNDMTVTDIPAGTVNLSTTLTPGTYGTEVGQDSRALPKMSRRRSISLRRSAMPWLMR